MQKLGKKPLLTFIATYKDNTAIGIGSHFMIEGKNASIPSVMLRRNFPQAKTNTRLKIQFYPWEIDVGRTIWFRNCLLYGSTLFGSKIPELYYTFSRRGKVIQSTLPYGFQKFLRKNLSLKSGSITKLKMVVMAI